VTAVGLLFITLGGDGRRSRLVWSLVDDDRRFFVAFGAPFYVAYSATNARHYDRRAGPIGVADIHVPVGMIFYVEISAADAFSSLEVAPTTPL